MYRKNYYDAMVGYDREYLSPPDNEPRKAFRCDNCGEWVYCGEYYYELSNDLKFCENCLPTTLEECGREITSDDAKYTCAEYMSDDGCPFCSDDYGVSDDL